MTRRLVSLLALIGLVVASSLQGAGAQEAVPPETEDRMRAFSIVPPGQNGTVTVDELPEGPFGEHYDDQLDLYASLVEDKNISEAELGEYFHSMQFGFEGEPASEYSPIEGATVYRDALGIPHIYADNLDAASHALGYVAAEDRLFQMDILRHAARGNLAEFVGAGTDNAYLNMDIETRREGYTAEELTAIWDKFDERFGKVGERLQTGLQAYADGVNAYIANLKTDPTFFNQRPAEYEATGNPFPAFPEDWETLDTLYLVVLQLRVFGETAGSELENAGLYARLVDKLGKKLGTKAYSDFLPDNDRRSPTSIPKSEAVFNSPDLGRPKMSSAAVPDNAEELAREESRRQALRESVLGSLGLRSPASNALLVSAKESATGNPLEIGAPQVGYAVPAFFMDIDVHVPGVDFRGPAVPGASALIPLGRGVDYAWSLTTGMSDAVDTRAELLCEPEGGEVTEESNFYEFKGECLEMQSRDETFLVKPAPTAPGPPSMETHTFYRTKHGPVFARGTVDGKPVAFVKQRFFWKKELDSLPPFYKWNSAIDSVADFKKAASEFSMSFNSFYADAEDVGYFHVGFYPKRKRGMHTSLPTWGTGEWEWKGRRPFRDQPQVINPKQGWLVNWNNKPSVGWDNMDTFKAGAVQRVALLQDRMHELLDGSGKAKLSDLVNVIRDAATRDARAVYVGPRMLKWAADAKGVGDARALVAEWIKKGSHRTNKDRDETMDDGAALLLFDKWWDLLVHGIFDDELGEDGYELMAGAPISDYSPAGGSSFFFDFSSYVSNLFNGKAAKGYARAYCDDTETNKSETCKQVVIKALDAAVAALVEEHGEDMSQWTAPAENLSFQALGAGSVPGIPWQNRGTHNHVVEILSDAG